MLTVGREHERKRGEKDKSKISVEVSGRTEWVFSVSRKAEEEVEMGRGIGSLVWDSVTLDLLDI